MNKIMLVLLSCAVAAFAAQPDMQATFPVSAQAQGGVIYSPTVALAHNDDTNANPFTELPNENVVGILSYRNANPAEIAGLRRVNEEYYREAVRQIEVLDFSQITPLQRWALLAKNDKADYIAGMIRDMPNLRRINLSQLDLSKMDVTLIGPVLEQSMSLRELDLCANHLGADGINVLAGMNLPHLQKLALSNNEICNKKAAQALARMNLPNLRELILNNNRITSDGIRALAGMNLPNLELLELGSNYIRSDAVQALAGMNLPNLRELVLYNNCITADGIRELAGMNLPHLKKLDLNQNELEVQGMQALAQMNLPNLEILYLQRNALGVDGMQVLAGMRLPNLQELSLSLNNIGNEGATVILHMNLPNLKALYMREFVYSNMVINDDVRRAVLARYPFAQF